MSKMNITPTIWHNCYDKSLKGFITDDSFAHPAKMSMALAERIIDYCLEQGWLKKGDVVGDPFNGVCTVGLVSAYRGLRYIGVELEPKFVKLSADNIELHRSRLDSINSPIPEVIQGDSRKFHELVEAAGIVSSPPFLATEGGAVGCLGKETSLGKRHWQGEGGERVPGNIETLKEGSIEAVVSSPPYAANEKHDYLMSDDGKTRRRDQAHQQGRGCFRGSESYGSTDGQIGRLNGGSVDTVVSSPPWEDNSEGSVKKSKFNYTLNTDKGHAASPEAKARQMERDEQKVYGSSPGQIGKLKGGAVDAIATSPPYDEGLGHGGGRDLHQPNRPGTITLAGQKEGYGRTPGQIGEAETYWQAVAQVYASCFQAIKPCGVICLVVKDYVKAGKRVPLCEDTARLLEHTGFIVIERIHAMLVKETTHDDFFGPPTVKTKSRKSFFRRLAEAKGSPKIDFEEVIIAQKPI